MVRGEARVSISQMCVCVYDHLMIIRLSCSAPKAVVGAPGIEAQCAGKQQRLVVMRANAVKETN